MASDARPHFHIVSIFSIIVELANPVSLQDENIERLTYHSTLFPVPATIKAYYQPLWMNKRWVATYVSHGSIGGNLLMLSIPRVYCR
jgi:hypothetical protein